MRFIFRFLSIITGLVSIFIIVISFIGLFSGHSALIGFIILGIPLALFAYIIFRFSNKDNYEQAKRAHELKKQGSFISEPSTSANLINTVYEYERDAPPIKNENGVLLPARDSFETEFLDMVDEIPLNLLVLLHYKDSNGNESRRRITIKWMAPYDNDYALMSYCHERKSHRTFLLSRVISMVDVETGEIINNHFQYLMDHYNNSPFGKYRNVLKDYAPEIFSLAFIARSDGRMVKKERQVIIDFINAVAREPIEELYLDEEIKRTYCELSEFRNNLRKLKETSDSRKNAFYEAAERIVNSDKKVDPMEKAALEKIQAVLFK